MIWASDLTTEVINSKLADTAPALVGVVVILAPVFWFVYRMSLRQERVLDKLSDAINNQAAASEKRTDADHARTLATLETIKEMGAQCVTHHGVQDVVDREHTVMLRDIRESTRRIEDQLGKVRRA